MSCNKLNLQAKVEGLLWPDEKGLSGVNVFMLKILRVSYASIMDLAGEQLSLRATSLVYTTLLSIIPLLALSFSVLKAMGTHNAIEPFLIQFLAPLGDKGIEMGENIIGFIDNINVGILGSLGLGLFIYTVFSLVQKIENAFNTIWNVETMRSIGERFSIYLSIILIGPVLMVSALGMTATVMSSSAVSYFMGIEPFGTVLVMATRLLPYFMVIGVFAFIYLFVPNAHVRFNAAIIGAVIAGFLWETSGVLFAAFVASSTKYMAVYSSFAVVIMLLIWLYISWLILLFGSNLAFYIQNPSSIRMCRDSFEISNRVKERLALLLLQIIGERHFRGDKPIGLDELTNRLSIPYKVVSYLLTKLISKQLIIESKDIPTGYEPAKSIDCMLLSDVVKAVRCVEEEKFLSVGALMLPKQMLDVVCAMDESVDNALRGQTIRDLVGNSAHL